MNFPLSSFTRNRGGSYVETIIVLPLVVLCLVGMLNLGRGLTEAFTFNRVGYEVVSLLGFTRLSPGTNTSIGHPRAHARGVALLGLQPSNYSSVPTISTTFVPAGTVVAVKPVDADDGGKGGKSDPDTGGKKKPAPPPFAGSYVITTINAPLQPLLGNYGVTLATKFVGPYLLSNTSMIGSTEFSNPSPLVNCAGAQQGASGMPCSY